MAKQQKKQKVQRIPVDNIKNEPVFTIDVQSEINAETQYLISTVFKDDTTLQDDILNIKKTLDNFKLQIGEGVNDALIMQPICPFIHNGHPVGNYASITDEDSEHLKTIAGNNIENNVINNILIPALSGVIHPNGAYMFPDWEYNGRYVDIKAVYVERSKQKYQAKFKSPVYNNALEDSGTVLAKLRKVFKYNINDEESYKFCHSLLVYCYYEVFENHIRILGFNVVPTIQAIQTRVLDDNETIILSEKNLGKNTNTLIRLTYDKKSSVTLRTSQLFKLINQTE